MHLYSQYASDARDLERQCAQRREATMIEDGYEVGMAMRRAARPRYERAPRERQGIHRQLAAALTALAAWIAPSL